jgi:hypothetical protein
LEKHAPLVVAFPELARYQVNLVPAGEEEGFADGVAEVCFNDLETLRRITSSQQVKTVQQDSVVHSAAINRLLVQEHPIACGHYATPRRLSEAPCRPDSPGHGWWLGQHRELAEQLPGLRRYILSLAAETQAGPFDGMAEL